MATIKGGRPGDPVRMFFQKLDGTKSKCVECGEQCSSKIERLRAHIKRYSKLKATPVSISSGLKPDSVLCSILYCTCTLYCST
jgi:ribosomal protein L34E